MQKLSGSIVYSPSDLVRFVRSPFASWMDRFNLERPGELKPDEESEDEKLLARTGDEHERAILEQLKASLPNVVEIDRRDLALARARTAEALAAKASVIYQPALELGRFSGFADFLILDPANEYMVWDTKLARSPKPYYAIQLCCYSEMLAAAVGGALPRKFGLILGDQERVEFRIEDFVHYYRHVKRNFLAMQDAFSGNFADRPEPLPRNEHGPWTSHAQQYFEDTDHLVRVAGITVGQIKKLRAAGIGTTAELAAASGRQIPRLAVETLETLSAQARLQLETVEARRRDAAAPPRYEPIAARDEHQRLASLPPADKADVFFDIEGYPLAPGGLEYLFGACARTDEAGRLEYRDWWAHGRDDERAAFEGFVDWAYARWNASPAMHIYHYAAYEVSALRRLSIRHDTRQDEVDDLLRNHVFVDLFQIVRHGLRIGESSYSLKAIERLYRGARATDVATGMDSIVRYAHWIEMRQSQNWQESATLKSIRDYNEDDCRSTFELADWLRGLERAEMAPPAPENEHEGRKQKEVKPEAARRQEIAAALQAQGNELGRVLADVVDFHRREEKPMWWRKFDRAEATAQELRDDSGCIQGIQIDGGARREKQSLLQPYRFDPAQECKLSAGDKSGVMFTDNIEAKITLAALDADGGTLALKISQKGLNEKFGGGFPEYGSLIPDEYVNAETIQVALADVAARHLDDSLPLSVAALLNRTPPPGVTLNGGETAEAGARRIVQAMNGGCLVIQGPPGTGKTHTAARMISDLVNLGKRVGISSNSHKAIVNLLLECGEVARTDGGTLRGIKVGGEDEGPLFAQNPDLLHVEDTKDARPAYNGGVIGGTAWLFARPEWDGVLDFLFIDEAGQVSLANALAIARSAKNLVLLGDQMQLEQPLQGAHPGDSGLSALQYALKDLAASRPDAPAFHAVVPTKFGLFLAQSYRMHPSICALISDSVYDGRLAAHASCEQQRIAPPQGAQLVLKENGVLFSSVTHDGNVQQSDEEVERVVGLYHELLGREYTALVLADFLFVAPYNAQVRALRAALPAGARVGSVDKFQGQQAPVCILSLCSSYGEYGSRGLGFILDKNRINVAISRAQCLAIVVADPRIAQGEASSLATMSQLNLFCKIVGG